MTNTRPRRALVTRLLRPRPSRRPAHVVGACAACGANFAGGPGQESQVAEILRVHEALCPGGRRAGELVRPFG